MIYPTALTLALFFSQSVRALPQGSPLDSPWSPSSSTYTASKSTAYPPSTTVYPSSTTVHPPSTTVYPPSSTAYPPSSTAYPPSTTAYPTSTTAYPPSTTAYPPSTTAYPPSTTAYPPSTTAYPPEQTTAYPPKTTPCSPSKPETPMPLRATYDTTFDNTAGSLNGVACSNGANGLASRFPTFGDIPSFPFIGGVFDVAWNSPNCGGCWAVTNPATGSTINITAVDTAGAGFNLSKEAFDELAGGQSGVGAVDVVATKVSPSVCGL
jgi:hypothetical protein